MQKTNQLMDSAQGVIANVDETANNLNSISSKINQGRGTIGSLVDDKKIYQNVNAGANAFQENMEALKHNFFLRGFFNRRGYENAADLTKHEISQLPPNQTARKFSYDVRKLFEKQDTAKLKESKVLKDAGAYLEGNLFGVAVVASYTDMKGDTDKDRLLTEARAMVVRDYLIQNFKLDDTRIKTLGLGKSKEVSDGGRVDVLVYPVGTNVAQTYQAPPKP